MALVLKGSLNSKFKIIPNIDSYKSIIINNNNEIINLINYNSNGYIGIGTETPNERFELKNGQLKISSDSNIKSSVLFNNNNLNFLNSNNEIIGLIGINNNYPNYLDLFTSNNLKGYSVNGELLLNEMRPEIDKWHRTIDNNERFYFSSNSTTIFKSSNGFKWNNNENKELLYLSNNGFIGIGISNPKTILHVGSLALNQFPLKISSTSNNNDGTFIALNSSDVNYCKSGIGHIKTGDYDTGDIIFINRNSLDDINVNSHEDEKLRIKNNGNIGIGIKNPIANLHINNSNLNQTVSINISDGNNLKGLSLIKSSNNNSYLINNENTNISIGVSNDYYNNYNHNNLNRNLGIRIDNSNNLNLNNNLNFDSYSNSEITININNNHKGSLLYYNLTNNQNPVINLGRDIGWGKANIIIDSNLGIGTSPIEKLHVEGIIASINKDTSNFIRIFNQNSTAFIDAGSSENGIVFRINKSIANYGNPNFTETMRIKSNGNVGIGNNNPITTGTDTNLCIGNSSLLNSSGFLIIGKNSVIDNRQFKIGYGDNYFMTIGDFGNNNTPSLWKQQVRIHWNCPSHSFLIYENGDANLYGRLYQASDIKLKTNVRSIDNALNKVTNLNGVEYSLINDNNDNNDNNNHIGLIAQEVEKVIPQVVYYNKETDLKSVAYANLTPLLINAIKELNEKINKIETKLNLFT